MWFFQIQPPAAPGDEKAGGQPREPEPGIHRNNMASQITFGRSGLTLSEIGLLSWTEFGEFRRQNNFTPEQLRFIQIKRNRVCESR